MSDTEHKSEDTIPFYPDHIKTEFYVVLGILAVVLIIGIIAIFNPVGVGEPADPLNTPLHVKPEWYFLSLYQILKKIPPMVLGIQGKIIGVVLPIVLVGLIFLWPFIDYKPDTSRKVYRWRTIFVIIAVITIIALTIWGEVS
jgi:quinol-cytochrome oxidoreductase complex cytochrome b subunit